MVINNLVDAVARFCESTLVNLMQPAPDKVTEIRPGSLNRTELISEKNEKSEASYKRISIFKGCLPPKRQSENDDYPFVLVVPSAGTVDREFAHATVNIYCGSWHDGNEGYAEVLNIVQRLLIALSQIESSLDKRYIPESNVKWIFPDASAQAGAPKMWQAMITTNWKYHTSSNNLPIKDEYFEEKQDE